MSEDYMVMQANTDIVNAQPPTLDDLVEQAKKGSQQALEEIVRQIQDDIYRLALKMLSHPEDAQDATQEILIRIITHLGSFRGDSTLKTWTYRVAANYLLTTRKRRAEQQPLTFAEFGDDLSDGLSDAPIPGTNAVEQGLLEEEVKLSCTQGLLLCLDRDHRIVYILGEILEIKSEQGGRILNITPAAFRKRLSRARQSIRSFMQQKCGLINESNECRCRRRVKRAIELGRIDPNHLVLATHPTRAEDATNVQQGVQEVQTLEQAVAHLHRHPAYAAPDIFLQGIKELVNSGEYELFR
ncbi:RNA polymerase sigma factor [Chloroflexi bacterium TSY]|nr:RNA polymerase sigma factor [Chloroflexi bacterium TSY]